MIFVAAIAIWVVGVVCGCLSLAYGPGWLVAMSALYIAAMATATFGAAR